jgi:hypothetical protein
MLQRTEPLRNNTTVRAEVAEMRFLMVRKG